MELTVMGVISWIVFGLIVGAIARLLMPGRQSMGMMMTMLLGVVGSFVGGLIGSLFTGGGEDGYMNPAGWIMSILGAIIVLGISGMVAKRT